MLERNLKKLAPPVASKSWASIKNGITTATAIVRAVPASAV